jgi:hypothetical protein
MNYSLGAGWATVKSGGEPPHSKMAEALGQVARQLHGLQMCVAFDELFCAAAGETH